MIDRKYLEAWENAIIYCGQKLHNTSDLVVIDWAGIGDANCHSRLIIEHLICDKKISWLTVPLASSLYRDDYRLQVLPLFTNPQRDPHNIACIENDKFINELISKHLNNRKILNISHNIVNLHLARLATGNYSEVFFRANGLKRNLNVKHSLIHKTKAELRKKTILLEFASATFGVLQEQILCEIVQKISDLNYDIVLCGSLNDNYTINPNTFVDIIDLRGYDLYDVFSYAKSCNYIIGRSSGNQSLACFLPNIPLIEIDVPAFASYKDCQLHPYVRNTTSKEFCQNIDRFIM